MIVLSLLMINRFNLLMEIHLLKIFKTVCEEKSVTNAAKKLHYVQSNITARIKQLEDELGTILFYRKNRKIEITPAGLTLYEYSNRIINLADEARKAVQDSDGLATSLTIASIESTAAVRLPSIINRFHNMYPDFQFILKTAPTEKLIHQVLNREVEGAFIGREIEHPDLSAILIFIEELVFVSADSVNRIENLENLILLSFSEGCSYKTKLKEIAEEMQLKFSQIMEFGSFETLFTCVSTGMGITLFPESLVKKYQEFYKLKMHPLEKGKGSVKNYFIYRKDLYQTRAFKAFKSCLKELL